jgi:hypothetical protein
MIMATSSSSSEDAGVEGDLAAGHAEGVDLVAAEQVDLPAPLARPLIAGRRERHHARGDVAQALELRAARGQRARLAGLVPHLRVLLLRHVLDVAGRRQRRGA